MSDTNTPVTSQVSAIVVSILRTVVPAAWGAAFTWLVTQVPAVEALREQADLIGAILLVVAIGAWYALWRKLEPHLPAWVRALTLGFPAAPAVYAPQAADVVAVQVTKPADETGAVSETVDTSGDSGGTVVPARKPYWDPV